VQLAVPPDKVTALAPLQAAMPEPLTSKDTVPVGVAVEDPITVIVNVTRSFCVTVPDCAEVSVTVASWVPVVA
jgi:hypothetical protein